MRSKADINHLNLPHETKNYKVEKRRTKKRKRICCEPSVNSPWNPRSQSGRKTARTTKIEMLNETKPHGAAAVDQRDRQTDGRTDGRTPRAASITQHASFDVKITVQNLE